MNENYVTLSLEKYDELNTKAKKFDELVNTLGDDVSKALKDALDGLVQCTQNIKNDLEKEGNEDE